eukprot:8466-Alexandrium_andersonii.AAC.1
MSEDWGCSRIQAAPTAVAYIMSKADLAVMTLPASTKSRPLSPKGDSSDLWESERAIQTQLEHT